MNRLLLAALLLPSFAVAETTQDISYRPDATDAYQQSRCKLDIYKPNGNPTATVVWFHGGGLTQGGKEIPTALQDRGLIVVGVNYRLSPKVKVVDCIDDAAAAVAWTLANIEKHGGSADRVFVAGHSAGGYLTSMVGLDPSRLAKYDVKPSAIAGLIPLSGHTITHFTAREERGIDGTQPVVDELAPLTYVGPETPPLLLITGDRELELLGRYEENAYFWRMMQLVGHTDCRLHELGGFNHSSMQRPAHELLVEFVSEISDELD